MQAARRLRRATIPAAPVTHTAPTLVQHVGGAVAAGSATSVSATASVATTLGHSLVVHLSAPSTAVTVTSVTDSKSNTYVQDTSAITGNPSGVWRCQSATALTTSDTITATFSGAVSTSGAAIWVDEISGINATTPLDTTPTVKTASSTVSPTSPAITTATDHTLVLTSILSNGACGTTLTVSGSYTAVATKISTAGTGTGTAILVAQQSPAAAGSVSAGTFSSDSHSYSGTTVAYRGT